MAAVSQSEIGPHERDQSVVKCRLRLQMYKVTSFTLLWRMNIELYLIPFGFEKCFFGQFLPRLSRIKRSEDILMGKFGPTALNFFRISDLGAPAALFGEHPVYVCPFDIY